MLNLNQKVIFVLGKGGVGRTTISASLGYYYAQKGLKTLIIQWTMRDFISPLFEKNPVGHKHEEILPNLFVMNYDPSITLHEYFVEHLNMTLFFKFIIENPQVKKLIQAAPGLEELFFLGRIFWLVELAKEERGYEFDKIIVDSPATGHGSALFGIISTISNFKLEGPLISEATRVAKLLENKEKIGTVIVTLPEELPYEETVELFKLIEKEMKRKPLTLFINKSVHWFLKENHQINLNEDFFNQFTVSKNMVKSLHYDLKRKIYFENKTKETFSNLIDIKIIPDLTIINAELNPKIKIQEIANIISSYEQN
jgi:anion-transporting  ArsA/GET3 family ATPase